MNEFQAIAVTIALFALRCVLPLALLFAIGYAAMSRHITTTGAFYGYISHGLGRIVGLGAGVLTALAYMVFEAALIGIFSFFGADLFSSLFGVTVPVTAQTAGLTLSCLELVQNGGFEQGAAGWQTFSAQGYDLISNFNPHTGSLGAYMGGVNNADDRLSQALTLPAGTTLTLKAWWYLATAETADTFDTLTIALTAADGTPLSTLATLGNMVNFGRDYLITDWWIATIPGIVIFLLALAISMLGDWLRDIMDPTLR